MRHRLGRQVFKVTLLICAICVEPPDCQEDTALHVLIGPRCQNEVTCAMQAQAYLASTELGRSLEDDRYLKIKITRDEVRGASSR